MPLLKPNGHFACPGSQRGHTWSDVPGKPDRRVCTRCGETGRVTSQGAIVVTHSTAYHEILKLNPERWQALRYEGKQPAYDPEDPKRELELRTCACGSTLAVVIGGDE